MSPTQVYLSIWLICGLAAAAYLAWIANEEDRLSRSLAQIETDECEEYNSEEYDEVAAYKTDLATYKAEIKDRLSTFDEIRHHPSTEMAGGFNRVMLMCYAMMIVGGPVSLASVIAITLKICNES